jgi:hypothetical protein
VDSAQPAPDQTSSFFDDFLETKPVMEIGSKRIPPAKDAARSSTQFFLELLA